MDLPRPHLLAPLALAALAACGDGPYVVVTVQARPAAGDVRTLAVTLANASATQGETFVIDGRTFPLTFSVDTGGRTGDLAVTVDGEDGTGTLVARGLGTTALDGATDSMATVMLEPTDFLVNTSFVGDQALAFRPDAGGRQITVSTTGVATIGWSDSCQVVGRCDVFGRRFSATGRPVSTALAAGPGEFRFNRTDVTGFEPSMATNAAGRTVAVWSTGNELLAVVVDAEGNAITASETSVALGTLPSTPAVIAVPDGRFVVVWTERAPTAGQYLVRARYLSTDGTPALNPITLADTAYTVSTTIMTEANPPAVAWLGDGLAMVVTWRIGSSLRGRFYTSSGPARAATDTLLLSRPLTDTVGEPQVLGAGGDAVLLYPHSGGGDANELSLRRVTPTGTLVGAEALVTTGVELTPAALAGSVSELVAAWTTCAADSDDDACAIRYRRFDLSLAPLGPSQIVNTTTTGSQQEPSVAYLLPDTLLVAWSDASATPPDQDGFGIRARIVYPGPPAP